MEPAEFWKVLSVALLLFGLIGSLTERERRPRLGLREPGRSRGGCCLVCRDSMSEDLVECGQCRTPHHRACWDYVGSCSVYGCGGRN